MRLEYCKRDEKLSLWKLEGWKHSLGRTAGPRLDEMMCNKLDWASSRISEDYMDEYWNLRFHLPQSCDVIAALMGGGREGTFFSG